MNRITRRNYGWGKGSRYAVKCALRSYYQNGHYSSTHTHLSRFTQLIDWVEAEYQIKDLRDVSIDHADAFFWEKERTSSKKYLKSLVSTWNVVMRALTGSDSRYIEPLAYSGRVSGIRTVEPNRDKDSVWKVIDKSLMGVEPRVGAIIAFARFFGMRSQETILADIDRIIGEARATGGATILEGCKGGRESSDRIIPIGPDQKRLLKLVLEVRPSNSFNLLDANEDKRQAGAYLMKIANKMLDEVGLGNVRELRAAFLCDAYESETGQPIPLIKKPIDKELDMRGRRVVARLGGHGRISVSNAYIGK